MKFRDIPKFTQTNYRVDVTLDYLLESIDRYKDHYDLDMDPDFQRAHVWTEDQQIAYVEYFFRGGKSGRDIFFNCTNWMNDDKEQEMVLVDGKQRLEALRRFLENEIPLLGNYFKDFEGRMGLGHTISFWVNDLPDREAVLKWYLEMNSGGTPHSKAELDKVVELLNQERN